MIDLVLVLIALIWLGYSSYCDIKTREVPDWISYSLIIIALAFYLVKSLILKDSSFIIQSLFGLLMFFLLGNLMYYTRQWGGGDVKLLSALGSLFPVYPKELLNYLNPNLNISFLLILIMNLIIFGALYSIIFSFYLIIKNKVKINFKINKIYLSITIIILLSSLFVNNFILKLFILLFALLIFVYPLIKNYVRLIEKNIMIKKIPVNKLTEGDWIIKNIYFRGKLIYNKNNPGITISDIKLLKKYKIRNVLIKEGMPFIPSFLISLIVSLIFGNLLMI